MADIFVHAPSRQPGVPAGAVRSKDINQKNDHGWQIATALERPRILHVRRNSHVMVPPEILMPYFQDAGFGQVVMLTSFHFDLALLSASMKRWRPETNNFHMAWGEVIIIMQDVVYHI
ncbi:hypothetical protein PIB30_083983 [Stylosanthes scabra]|uniref:Aminotransferase-like plant mobile domain-containing protein n=1 Tax=Stylosanthes scabra TaxID=79078 RepID=A0ABU6XSA4_9FABA|nr:hypothetical protein [Stylosanthes scabra]